MSNAGSYGGAGPNLGRELSTAVVLFHQALAARLGLSAGDLKTLELIQSEGPFSATELARRTGLTGAGITSVISRLTAGGYIERATDPHDRRRAIIRATDTDSADLDDAFAQLGRSLGGAINHYTPQEQAAIVSYLGRVIDALKEQTTRLGGAAGAS